MANALNTNTIPQGSENKVGNAILWGKDSSGNYGPHSATNPVMSVDARTGKATYRASTPGILGLVQGDCATIFGSATKTIRITKVEITANSGNAGSVVSLELIKRSTANSGGTAVALPMVPLDSTNAAASATLVNSYAGGAPTPGTSVGPIWTSYTVPQTLVGLITQSWIADFGAKGQEVVLRGTAQGLVLNHPDAVGGSFSAAFEWTEE